MTWEGWVAVGIVVLAFYALARNLAPTDVVLIGAATLMAALGLIPGSSFPTPKTMAQQFGNEGLITVGALFVVAAGLTETGAIAMLTERVLGRPKSAAAAQVRLMLPTGAISAFINNTPVVAMFVPVINDWSKRIGVSPSKLFMPLSYAAILGGVCTLIGTSTNLVVQGQLVAAHAQDPSIRPFGFWTIGAVGLPVALVGFAYILLASPKLLPDRGNASPASRDPRQYTVEMMVQPGSAVDGQTVEAAGLRQLPGAYLVEIDRDGETIAAVAPDERLRGNDRLIFVGVVGSVVDLRKVRGLVHATDHLFKPTEPRHNRALVEAVVSAACPLVGSSIREGKFRTRYEAAVVAVHRGGERIAGKIGDIVLRAGDTLLMEAHPRFYRVHRDSHDFYLVSQVPDSHRRRHDKAWLAVGILAAMIVAMTFESLILVAALVGAGLMLVTRCLSTDQARRSVEWNTLLAIGAAFGIGRAMESTGAAGFLGGRLVDVMQQFGGAWGVLLAVYLTTLVFTELVTNNAAAALAFPIARAAADAAGADFMPFAVCVALAASCGFATPLGYQTHLMVYGPGGYRFGDFFRMGLPLDLICMLVAVGLAPLFFPF